MTLFLALSLTIEPLSARTAVEDLVWCNLLSCDCNSRPTPTSHFGMDSRSRSVDSHNMTEFDGVVVEWGCVSVKSQAMTWPWN
jgi:hypothetical protein